MYASFSHDQPVRNLKAAAAKASVDTIKSDSSKDLTKQSSSSLPADSIYGNESKIQKKVGSGNLLIVTTVDSSSASATNKQMKRTLPEGFFDDAPSQSKPSFSQTMKPVASEVKKVKGAVPDSFLDSEKKSEVKPISPLSHSSKVPDGSNSKHLKGMLPEGFFDNKDADLRARGIQPVKVDINDAYKEFEKEIQEDLQEVDDRLEEEEIDAAEIREEYESLEQMQYRERVEMVKKRLTEVKAAKLAKGQQRPAFMDQESSDESSSDTDKEENFAVDWRAKHLE